jgi:hypothetical protein
MNHPEVACSYSSPKEILFKNGVVSKRNNNIAINVGKNILSSKIFLYFSKLNITEVKLGRGWQIRTS